jgi:hypothetical protein
MNEQARRTLTPNQVRHPTDCRFTSGCSPPRLAATQLPSITEPTTGSGSDLHRAVKASSRTHSFPRKRESSSLSDLGGGPVHNVVGMGGWYTRSSGGMSNFREVDREMGFLLPPSVDEWLLGSIWRGLWWRWSKV